MSNNAKMRKMSVRIDTNLKAAFEDVLWGTGIDPTCAMRSFGFQVVLENGIPFDPADIDCFLQEKFSGIHGLTFSGFTVWAKAPPSSLPNLPTCPS